MKIKKRLQAPKLLEIATQIKHSAGIREQREAASIGGFLLFNRARECPPLAQSGHDTPPAECPLE
jgi:hypothetical protein